MQLRRKRNIYKAKHFGSFLVSIFLIFSLILELALPVLTVASAFPDIIITKIAAFEKSGYEWVEIYNRSIEPVNTEGWKFWENETNHGWTLAQGADLILNSREKFAIVQDKDKFLENYPDYPNTIIDSSWGSLNESGEEIGLKDANLDFVEVFSYIQCPDNVLERKNFDLDDYSESNWKEKQVAEEETGEELFFVENIAGEEAEENNSQLVNDNPVNNDSGQNSQSGNLPISKSKSVVENIPPVAIIGDDLEINIGDTVFFDGADSFDKDGNELEYFWDFGDSEEGEGMQIEHQYLHSGKFSAILRVFDGKITASNAIWIKVNKVDYPREIYINSFMPNPAGADATNEWVEICSNELQVANLTGWILDDVADGGSREYVIDNFEINSNECAKLYRGQTRIAINNDKDSVRLLNPYKEIIDEISFNKKVADNEIIYRTKFTATENEILEKKVLTYVVNNNASIVETQDFVLESVETQDFASLLPMAVKTGDIEKGNLDGEIVKIAGNIIEKSGNTFFVNDGSGLLRVQILPNSKIKYDQFFIGGKMIITGVVSRTEIGYRIIPEKIEG